jgi:hypothetical protein
MAYKNRPITNIVNKAHIYLTYYDKNNTFWQYWNDFDVLIETIGDLNVNSCLTIYFKFIVPSDYPAPENILRIEYIQIALYNTEELGSYPNFIFISGQNYESIFGKPLRPNEEAKLMFVIPGLQFNFVG